MHVKLHCHQFLLTVKKWSASFSIGHSFSIIWGIIRSQFSRRTYPFIVGVYVMDRSLPCLKSWGLDWYRYQPIICEDIKGSPFHISALSVHCQLTTKLGSQWLVLISLVLRSIPKCLIKIRNKYSCTSHVNLSWYSIWFFSSFERDNIVQTHTRIRLMYHRWLGYIVAGGSVQ